ncbi:hypothetical protein [Yoonia sp. 2307UL14-13]|uniref:hypothetical protein n=1 Tax=Yoonia sp. 2307UL14-13 TaxID=3126506 RepID=UPI0030B2C9C2
MTVAKDFLPLMYLFAIVMLLAWGYFVDASVGFLIGGALAIATGLPFVLMAFTSLLFIRKLDALVISAGAAVLLAFLLASGVVEFRDMLGLPSTYAEAWVFIASRSFLAFLFLFSLVQIVLVWISAVRTGDA